MQKKIALVAFNGEMMCFVHVLLNALDMHSKGFDVKVIIEGSATKLISALSNNAAPFFPVYSEVREKGLIDCVCFACASKMGSLEDVKAQGPQLSDEMSGHPSLARYIEQGYEVISL